MNRCATCHSLVQAGEAPTTCPECRQEYHASCWQELGGCATYGCKEAVAGEKPVFTGELQAGWGDSKSCPSCGGVLHPSALACPCGAKFPDARTMTRDEYTAWSQKETGVRGAKQALAGMFLFSLLGLPAPLLGPVAAFVAYRCRKELAGADGTYLALGYGTAAIGFTHAVVVVLLLLGY